ncbi:hypothetical protein ACFQH6_16110 [Halobacteriaceae archaeon GCM10025711]
MTGNIGRDGERDRRPAATEAALPGDRARFPAAETMAATGFPDLAVNLIYTVLCLVPGFVSLKTASYVTGHGREFDQFDKSAWCLIGSGASLSLLYFAYVAWVGLATGRLSLVVPVDIKWVELVAVYPVLLVVAAVVGLLSGRLLERYLGPTATTPEAADEQAQA